MKAELIVIYSANIDLKFLEGGVFVAFRTKIKKKHFVSYLTRHTQKKEH